jgi:hypothetical protein
MAWQHTPAKCLAICEILAPFSPEDHALEDNGVPVEFIAIPVRGHFPGDVVRQMDVYRHSVDLDGSA